MSLLERFSRRNSTLSNSVVSATDEKAVLAIRNFLQTFSFVKPDLKVTADLPASYPQLLQEIAWRCLARGVNDAVVKSGEETWFDVNLNGVSVSLPRHTMRTMRHCLGLEADGTIRILAETDHWKVIQSQFKPGCLFVDVGAAAGTMSVPYALASGNTLQILAFEPSPRTRYQFERTIAKNGTRNITVSPAALSDEEGQLEFIELPLESGDQEIPWLSEGSRLSAGETSLYPGDKKVSVPVRTLDAVAEEHGFRNYTGLVIKIDVEGFEDKVLLGGSRVLAKYRPFLSIDIHYKPGTTESIGPDVRAILDRFNYEIKEMGHVYLCHPH